jgi:hypothetical protein
MNRYVIPFLQREDKRDVDVSDYMTPLTPRFEMCGFVGFCACALLRFGRF